MNIYEERHNEIIRQIKSGAGYEDLCSKYECEKDQLLDYLEKATKKKNSKLFDECYRLLRSNSKKNGNKKRKEMKKAEKAQSATNKPIIVVEDDDAKLADLNKSLLETEAVFCEVQMSIRNCYVQMRKLKDIIDTNMKHPVVAELLGSIDSYNAFISKLKQEEDRLKSINEQKNTITEEINALREKMRPVVFVYQDGNMDVASGSIVIDDSGKESIFEFLRDRQECQQLTLMDAKTLATTIAVARNAKKEVTFEFDHDRIKEIYLKVYEALEKSEG